MKHKEYEAIGIVLDIKKYNDNDGILKVLLPNGINFLYAIGIQKPTSKNRLNLLPLSLVNLEIIKSNYVNKINTLKRATLISYFPLILNKNDIYNTTMHFLNHINNNNTETFVKKYQIFLNYIENYPNQALSFLLLNLLEVFGFRPNFKSCVECKNVDNIIDFEFYKGGFLCKEHSNSYKDIDFLKSLYWLYKDLDIFIKKFDENNSIKINAMIIEFLNSVI